MFLPLTATGLVAYKLEEAPLAIGGSCAAYLARHIVVTASHCVPERAGSVFVVMPGEASRQVIEIERHENADIAVLITQRPDEDPLAGHVYLPSTHEGLVDGGDFIAYGYPAGPTESKQAGRLMKGHFQRYFSFEPPWGGGYLAGEMSIPAPAGMSGGPVSWAFKPQELIGVVTTNADSYTAIDSILEVDDNGKSYRETNNRIISYGIAAMLAGKQDWLRDICAAHE